MKEQVFHLGEITKIERKHTSQLVDLEVKNCKCCQKSAAAMSEVRLPPWSNNHRWHSITNHPPDMGPRSPAISTPEPNSNQIQTGRHWRSKR
ncbi:hypothetical protein ACLB2K_046465 [Fragaria x ananassa]